MAVQSLTSGDVCIVIEFKSGAGKAAVSDCCEDIFSAFDWLVSDGGEDVFPAFDWLVSDCCEDVFSAFDRSVSDCCKDVFSSSDWTSLIVSFRMLFSGS